MFKTEDIFATTYEDLCTIYRRQNDVKDPITKQMTQVEEIIAENVKCALSQSSGGGINFSDQHGSFTRQHKLFTYPNTDIKAGDKIVITNSSGETRTLWAGNPFPYPGSHKETPLYEEERN